MIRIFWLITLIVVTIAPPAFAKEDCKLGAMGFDLMRKENPILEQYANTAKRDRTHCESVDIDWYVEMNKKISAILENHHCTWEDLTSFHRIESKIDLGCTDPAMDIELMPLIGLDGNEMDNVPIEAAPLEVQEREAEDRLMDAVETEAEMLPDMVSIEPPILTAPPVDPKPPNKTRWLMWSGVATSTIGLGLMGSGGYFGIQANTAASSARNATIQTDVSAYNREATGNASNANLMLGIGGVITAAGIGLVVLDFAVLQPSTEKKPKTTVSVGAAPGSASLTVRF